jgi:undecaprenyl diphosphate synthase
VLHNKSHKTLQIAAPSELGPVTPEEAQLLEKLDLSRLPRHVAVIMDGNGRWAQKRHLPRIAGHRSGTQSARTTIETCARLKLEALTLYAFSVENWRRPKTEIDFLMQLLREYLRKEMPLLQKNKIRMRFLGRIDEVTEEQLSRHLYTEGLPDPDLLIRTSGEMRVSNFLLWQIAYAEIFVTETLWPDFNRARLLEALLEFQKRERRYGGIREGEPSDEKPARVAGH